MRVQCLFIIVKLVIIHAHVYSVFIVARLVHFHCRDVSGQTKCVL